ncbi:hypothetical protein W220_00339 [Staphylococcus aureus DAR1200]|nr:hypothetical protein W220_00339 [Staphylococcus aureus DAR1200]
MINIPKMKFPKKYTEIIKKYKNKTPEEKAKIEDDFINDTILSYNIQRFNRT